MLKTFTDVWIMRIPRNALILKADNKYKKKKNLNSIKFILLQKYLTKMELRDTYCPINRQYI